MTLDEWDKLTHAERHSRIIELNGPCEDWVCDVLSEAARSLENSFKTDPRITHVGYTKWHDREYSPRLLVTTTVRTDEKIDALPNEWHGFLVEQLPILDTHDHYVRIWRLILSNLIGWTEDKVLDFIAQRSDDLLEKDSGWLYHDTPAWYLTNVVIDHFVPHSQQRVPIANQSRAELERVLSVVGSEEFGNEESDWASLQKRVLQWVAAQTGGNE